MSTTAPRCWSGASSTQHDYLLGEVEEMAAWGQPDRSTRQSSVRDFFFTPDYGSPTGTWQEIPVSARRTVTTTSDPKQVLMLTIAGYLNLPDDWDGYGGKAASLDAVTDALSFLEHFPTTFPLPKPMMAGSGVIGLYWERDDRYASIDFDGSGSYCYIADSANEENGEDAVAIDSPLPQALVELIATTADSL